MARDYIQWSLSQWTVSAEDFHVERTQILGTKYMKYCVIAYNAVCHLQMTPQYY